VAYHLDLDEKSSKKKYESVKLEGYAFLKGWHVSCPNIDNFPIQCSESIASGSSKAYKGPISYAI